MKVYTDGSYDRRNNPNICGFAVVFILPNGGFSVLYGGSSEKEYVEMWNVGGEILAARFAIDYCINKFETDKIDLYHDYIGISKWPTGLWKCNKDATLEYKKYVKEMQDKIKIAFYHVKGHSGDYYNMIADHYAKEGILLASNQKKNIMMYKEFIDEK